MKEKKNRIRISVILVAAMLAIVISGCGDYSSGTSNADFDDQTMEQRIKPDHTLVYNEKSDNDKVEIEVYHCTFNIASADSAEVKRIEDSINNYISDKINVKIKLTDLSQGEYEDKCNLAIANGEVNLFWTASWMTALSTDNLVLRKAVYELNEFLPGTDLYDSIPVTVWDSSRYNGKDFFIPCYKESSEGYDLVYPTEKALKYGWDLSSITKLSDLEPMLEQMKQDGVKYPFLVQMMPLFSKLYLDDYEFILGNTLIAVDRDTDEVVDCLTLSDYKEFLDLMSRWGEKGYVSDEEATKTIPETAINTTDWGFAVWWDVPVNDKASVLYGQDCDVVHMTKNYLNSSSTLGSCFGISSASTREQAKACVDFLELMYTDPMLAGLFTYGIEGTDYDLENGFVVKKGGLYDHSPWESGSIVSVPLESGEPENKVELYETFNKNAVESLSNGFRFNYSPVEAEWTACKSLYDQYGYVLEQGGYASEEVDAVLEKYKSELVAAGYEKVLSEAKKQYEEWKASE